MCAFHTRGEHGSSNFMRDNNSQCTALDEVRVSSKTYIRYLRAHLAAHAIGKGSSPTSQAATPTATHATRLPASRASARRSSSDTPRTPCRSLRHGAPENTHKPPQSRRSAFRHTHTLRAPLSFQSPLSRHGFIRPAPATQKRQPISDETLSSQQTPTVADE